MKTVIVHDWLYSVSGAEKVLEAIYEIFPSKVYTLIKNSAKLQGFFVEDGDIITSFIQKLPFGKTKYPYYLSLFPLAIEDFNVSDADVVLSSSSCVAKGVLTHAHQLHICYCHTPMRYIWDLYFDYLKTHKLDRGLRSVFTKLLFHKLRAWDLMHTSRVDHFIANSKHVARRIAKIYQKQADVIYPPVECDYFRYTNGATENFYLTAARLVPYKKVDVLIEAFAKMKDKTLVVVGEGPELHALKSRATKNIEFTGYVAKDTLKKYMHAAKAFLYMAYEDFGILPVEAQAAGLPVIAYGKGGVLETIIEGVTGLFFKEQTPQALIEAIAMFEKMEDRFDKKTIQEHTHQFSKQVFIHNFQAFVHHQYSCFTSGSR